MSISLASNTLTSSIYHKKAPTDSPLLKTEDASQTQRSTGLSEADKKLLSLRKLSDESQKLVESIYTDARSALQAGQGKAYLTNLDAKSLEALQGAAALADPINVASLSNEGAENLLRAPSEAVDRDGDGLIETGIAKTLQFPPANASPDLRAAWEKATANIDEGDKLTLSLLVSGASASVGDGPVRGGNFTQDFDWKSFINDRIYTNNISKHLNSSEEYNKIDSQLRGFLDALKEQGLA